MIENEAEENLIRKKVFSSMQSIEYSIILNSIHILQMYRISSSTGNKIFDKEEYLHSNAEKCGNFMVFDLE